MTPVESIATIIGSLIIIATACWGVMRALLKLRDTFKDMIRVTQENTKIINGLVTNQMTIIERIVGILERKIR